MDSGKLFVFVLVILVVVALGYLELKSRRSRHAENTDQHERSAKALKD
jgi:Tfp pilus assembly protein PilO